MVTTDLLQNLLLGGFLGLLGQGIRVVAGLKKLSESKKVDDQDSFDTRRLTVSLLLGFIAGALGSLTLLDEITAQPADAKNHDVIFKLVGIGYAGVDFLESFLTKYIPVTKEADTTLNPPGQSLAQTPTVTTLVPKLPYSSK